MCVYPSYILRPKLVINWTEEDSHETCISRLGLDDSSNHIRKFLRAEGKGNEFHIDEESDNLPSWYSDHEQEYREKCASIFKKINPIHKNIVALDAEYEAKRAPLNAEYKAKRDTLYAEYKAKRDTLDAEYEAKRAPLYAEYKAKRAPLYAEYEAKRAPLYAEYEAKRDTLDAEYEAKRAPLDAEYKAKCAPLIKKFSRIDGYVPTAPQNKAAR